MSNNNNFSRRRRGMRFKPKGGLAPNPQKNDRDATQARAEVVAEQGGDERLFEKRHQHEIERAENIAAGLPPEGKIETPEPEKSPAQAHTHEIPAAQAEPLEEKKFEPVKFVEPPKGLIETIKSATFLSF